MRKKARLQLITEEDYPRIHEASLKVLEQTGIIFHHQETVDLFKKHGAKVNGNIVYFSREMVEGALRTAPNTFKFCGRNGSKSLMVGQEQDVVIGANVGPVFVQDTDKGQRRGKLEDYSNFQKIFQASNVFNVSGSNPIDPSDVDANYQHLYMMYEAIKHTDKPLSGWTIAGNQVQEVFDMIEITMGKKGILQDNVYIASLVDSLSPLAWSSESCETIINFAKNRQVVCLAPASMTGITAPITPLGASVMQNSETLSGIVLTQLVNPGCPVIYGACSSPGNMRKCSFVAGSPQMMLINIPNVQMGTKFYKLPVRNMCGPSDSKQVDIQAGIETTQNLMGGVLSGVDWLGSTVGILQSVLTTSFEKVIIDQETISRVMCIRDGIDTSDEALSVDLINEVGHTGTYLQHPSTFKHFKNNWLPSISNWDSYEEWKEKGSEDIVVNANKKFKEILANAPEMLIDSELDKDLKAYMKKAMEK